MNKAMSSQVADLKAAFAAVSIELNTTLGKGLTKAALIVEGDYKVRLTKGGQVATGILRASASHRLIEKSGYPVAQIGSNTGYAKEVELGGPPRHVPFDNILAWVKRKGIAVGKEAEGVAFLIQRSIAEKGTMPHPALLPALVSNRDAIFKAIAGALKTKLAEKGVRNAS